MMIFQKSNSRHHKINIFDGGWVSLGAQNRPQEAPGGDKKRYRKKKKDKKKQERWKMLWDQTVPKILKALGPLGNPHEAPRTAPRAPKLRPRDPPNASQTIFGSKTLIFQKCKDFRRKTTIFKGGKVSLGAPKAAGAGTSLSLCFLCWSLVLSL